MAKTAPKIEPVANFFKHKKAAELKTYAPQKFLDAITEHLKLKNDAQLAKALALSAPVISKVRNRQLPVTPLVMLRALEATGWTPKQAREALGA